VRFEVRDTGIGIAAEAQRRLFEPFVQADSSTTRKHGGTGLGLAICRRLVESMGGEIGVDTAPNRGSCFWFTVPFRQMASAAADSPPVVARESSGAHGRVLVVEDSSVNQRVILAILTRLGYEADAVDGGQAALTALERGSFAAVLMDCRMPGLDGYQTTIEIRRREAERGLARTPIVAVTASALPGDRERCIAAGMDDFVSKPLHPDLLQSALARCQTEEPDAMARRRTFQTHEMHDVAADIVGLYLDEAPLQLAILRTAAARGHHNEVRRAAHPLGSASALLGLHEVSRLCRRIEHLGETDGIVGGYVAELDFAVGRALEALAPPCSRAVA
jgi:CheY-like chemotaxis protein